MSELIVPGRVAVDIENERMAAQVDATLGRAKEFFWRLQEIDPNLDLVLAHDNADAEKLRPGYWHVRRLNRGINDAYMPIVGPDGEWAEPSEYHLNLLRERDLWKDGGIDDIYRKIEARERASAERAADIRAEQRDVMQIGYKAAESPGVLMSDIPWSWRAGARRDR
jgi:hypothetical protein